MPRILSPPPQSWDFTAIPLCLAFDLGPGDPCTDPQTWMASTLPNEYLLSSISHAFKIILSLIIHDISIALLYLPINDTCFIRKHEVLKGVTSKEKSNQCEDGFIGQTI